MSEYAPIVLTFLAQTKSTEECADVGYGIHIEKMRKRAGTISLFEEKAARVSWG